MASEGADQPHAMFGTDGRRWLVVEKPRDGRMVLVATGDGITRSAKRYPSGWRLLSDNELYSLFERPFGREYTSSGVEDWSSSFDPEPMQEPKAAAAIAEWQIPAHWQEEAEAEAKKNGRADVERYYDSKKEREG